MVKYPQAVLIWTLIIPLAVLNGGLREHVLAPAIGNAALPVSGLILSLCIAVAAFLLVPKIKNLRKKDGIVFGVLWFCLTNLFDLSMYISAGKGSCASCVTNNMEFLRELQSRDLNIFVCVEGLDKREFTAFVRQYGIDDIAYRIYDFGFPKKELSPALFFTVDRNLSCRYFYAPSPWLPELNEVWYETIDGRVDLKK